MNSRQAFAIAIIATAALVSSYDAYSSDASCTATPTVWGTAPADAAADPVGPTNWYINEDQTIWVTVGDGFGVGGNKTYWVRPQGTDLSIFGDLVGSPGIPIRVEVPCCYTTGFQIVALFFDSAGCWHVSAAAGSHQLQFTTEVRHRE